MLFSHGAIPSHPRLQYPQLFNVAICALCAAVLLGYSTDSLAAEVEQLSERGLNALRQEAAGASVDRPKLIGNDSAHLSVADRWQIGQIKVGAEWKYLDDLSERDLSEKFQRYRQERGSEQLVASEHRRLANWCKDERLPAQAEAHWYGVLEQLPGDVQARLELGYEFIDGRWFSKSEVAEATARGRERIRSAEVWMPKIRRIVHGLQSKNTEKMAEALKQLREIDSPEAIFSLQVAAVQLEDDLATPFVSAISCMRCRDACLALTHIALRDPSSRLGQLAIEELDGYAPHFYIPELLALLTTPEEIRQQIGVAPNGELVLERIYFREFQKEKRVHTLVKTLRIQNQAEVVRSPSIAFIENVTMSPVAREALANNANNENQKAADDSRRQNDIDEARQAKAKYLIQRRAKVDLGNRAEAYWKWWEDFSDRIRVGNKLVHSTSSTLRSNHVNRRVLDFSPRNEAFDRLANIPISSTKPAAPATHDESVRGYVNTDRGFVNTDRPIRSCLVRGTPIQTADGLRPVDLIRVGDLVVAQNVESGELALRPVLRTTVRPPAKTVLITTESGKIESTQGHYFWVVGKGWMQARDMEPGCLLRDASSSTRVVSVAPTTEPAVTYNLVVADFHSYMVGPNRILSHDVTELRPSLKKVPGLPESREK